MTFEPNTYFNPLLCCMSIHMAKKSKAIPFRVVGPGPSRAASGDREVGRIHLRVSAHDRHQQVLRSVGEGRAMTMIFSSL
jgi:hypothetical protein